MWEKKVYEVRFSQAELERRFELWRILVDVCLKKYIKKADTVVDVGAGYGEFLRSIECRVKVAVDRISPTTLKNDQIRVINKDIQDIVEQENIRADAVMLSNILEHLPTPYDVLKVLTIVKKILKPGGKLLIIQPVIDLVGVKYWDFLDHQVVLSRTSLIEALESSGFEIAEFVPRFLPYTTKVRFPIYPWMMRLYLWLPWRLRPAAGQCFCVAVPVASERHK